MAQYTLDQWLLFFFIYGFLGWIWESLYVSSCQKKWVNRGFLYGPFIPMYGFGAIMNLLLTSSVKNRILLIFLLGMLGTTIFEYVTGVILQKLFHTRYWDYRRNRFNLNGYICPFCSFAWGIFAVIEIKAVHLFLESLVLLIPGVIVGVITMVMVAAYGADTALSVHSALHMQKPVIKEQIRESCGQKHSLSHERI